MVVKTVSKIRVSDENVKVIEGLVSILSCFRQDIKVVVKRIIIMIIPIVNVLLIIVKKFRCKSTD